jgi:hypothetical protein
MTKRRFIGAGMAAAGIALVLAAFAVWSSRDGVTKSNYDRIHKGMTLADVEALFGRGGLAFHGYPNEPAPAYCWQNEDGSLAIIFFEGDKVLNKAAWADSSETIGDKIRRLLRWPWW